MKIVLRIAPAALAIAGLIAVETPGQAMPVQAALIEFGGETRTARASTPRARRSSLHALCFVEQQSPSFITMNKQRPVVRYLTLRSPQIPLRCEGVFVRVTRWPQRLLPRDHTEARMRWCRRHLMATANTRA
jgi:hypothetical protein